MIKILLHSVAEVAEVLRKLLLLSSATLTNLRTFVDISQWLKGLRNLRKLFLRRLRKSKLNLLKSLEKTAELCLHLTNVSKVRGRGRALRARPLLPENPMGRRMCDG